MIMHSAGDIENYPLYTSAPCIAVQFCSETNNGMALHKSKFEQTARFGSVRAKKLSDSSFLVALCCIDATGQVDTGAAINGLRTVFLKAVETDATVFLQFRARWFPEALMSFIKQRSDVAVVFLSKVDNAVRQ